MSTRRRRTRAAKLAAWREAHSEYASDFIDPEQARLYVRELVETRTERTRGKGRPSPA